MTQVLDARISDTLERKCRSTTRVDIVATGGLGRALAPAISAALADSGRQVSERASTATPWPVGEPALGLLIADHDDPLADTFTPAWRAAGRPSMVVAQQHPDIRIGPLDVPETPLCGSCFAIRATWPGARRPRVTVASAEAAFAVSIDGFPPYLVSALAALTVARIAMAARPRETANEVTIVSGVSLAVATHPVVAVGACPACGEAESGHQLSSRISETR